jgi:2-oxoglutarate ferredoxin oxidoreductase subunit gamma
MERPFMLERLLIAGSGGQGVLLIGRVLATVAVNHVPHLTFFPAYGAEVRGGTSNCQVVLSSDPIPSPVCQRFDSMILMNRESMQAYLPQRDRLCLAVINSSLCPPIEGPGVVSVAATETAERLGDARAANFVLLGAYVARKPSLPAAALEEGVRRYLESKSRVTLDVNMRAFKAGMGA